MIVISEFMDEQVLKEDLGTIPLVYDPNLFQQVEELKGHLQNAKALIVRNKTQVNKALLECCPNLICVGRLGVGLDNIDLNACSDKNIKVFPATGANDISVAEYVIGASLILLRKAYLTSDSTLQGNWNRSEHIGSEVNNKTMGLVGLGAIGQLVAKYSINLGMRVIAYDPYLEMDNPVWKQIKKVTLLELVRSSDVISLHVPLIENTRNLFNKELLANCQKGAVIINTSRGGIVDERALAKLLKEGHLGGAALDVFANEPLNQKEGQKFLGLNNLILTPHIAGVTMESNYRVSKKIAKLVLDSLH